MVPLTEEVVATPRNKQQHGRRAGAALHEVGRSSRMPLIEPKGLLGAARWGKERPAPPRQVVDEERWEKRRIADPVASCGSPGNPRRDHSAHCEAAGGGWVIAGASTWADCQESIS